MRRVTEMVYPLWLAALVLCCGQDPTGVQEITELPRDLSAAEVELIEADNAFGLKLFGEIAEQEGPGKNIFVSPLSVAMALGMAYNGSAGTTREAMSTALELQGLSFEEVNESYRSLIDLLDGLDSTVEFTIGNSIWYDEGYTFRQDFLDRCREYFDAVVTGLDFASPDAAPTINAWVEEKTNGRIDDIVDSPIDPMLVMFLINAIYFKGDWTVRFPEDNTMPRPFRLADGSRKDIPMMSYHEPDSVMAFFDPESGVQVLDLSYGGRAYSMTIVLPQQPEGIDSLVSSLGASTWRRWTENLSETTAIVVMPKFTLEYELDMSQALKALGMEIAFDPDNADFSGMYSGPQQLFINKVKHKSFVDVNEKGTEAAAATSVEVGVTSMPPMIAVDRPFLFAIREKLSGTVLFLGLIMDPGGQ